MRVLTCHKCDTMNLVFCNRSLTPAYLLADAVRRIALIVAVKWVHARSAFDRICVVGVGLSVSLSLSLVLRRKCTTNPKRTDTFFVQLIQQAATLAGAAAGTATVAAATEPDESLVQALHKMGISSNRARRACVATRNASREAALAWCVEHSADPAMDAPFVSLGRRPAGSWPIGMGAVSSSGSGSGGGGGGGGGNSAGDRGTGKRLGEQLRAASRSRGIAAAALEAYVRARLSAMGESSDRQGGSAGGGGGGGDVGVALADGGVPSEEMGELVAVLTSFKQRQSLGQAEDKVRVLLPATVDLGRFAGDQRYRQVCACIGRAWGNLSVCCGETQSA